MSDTQRHTPGPWVQSGTLIHSTLMSASEHHHIARSVGESFKMTHAEALANAARIEGTGGDFLFYEEGVSDATGRLIEALEKERIAIGAKMGITVVPDPAQGMRQGYMLADDYGEAYRTAPGFLGIGAQPQLDHRYLNEDVGYGLVFMSRLARQLDVETPTMDAMIHITSVLMKRAYASEAIRTPTSLGIGDLSAEALGSL